MKTGKAADLTARLEADLARYPEERAQILIEAAEEWREAGEHDRAIALLDQVVAEGGEEGGEARVALADLLFGLDRVEEAQAQLDTLRRERPPSASPYHLAAELLEERGALDESLTWFTMAVSRLTEEELTQRDGEFGLHTPTTMSWPADAWAKPWRFPSDELDEAAESPANRAEDFTPRADTAGRGAVDASAVLDPCDEITRARLLAVADATLRRWPRHHGTADQRETPGTGARASEDLADEETRLACLNQLSRSTTPSPGPLPATSAAGAASP